MIQSDYIEKIKETDIDEIIQIENKNIQNPIYEVPVGSILVYNNEISFNGGNQVNETKNPTKHAEFICFNKAAKYANENKIKQTDLFKNSKLYVTTEPCIMCASAIKMLNLKSVFYGCKNERFGGCGSVENVIGDVPCIGNFSTDGSASKRSIKLLKIFYASENENAPVEKRKRKMVERRLKLAQENLI